MKTVLTKIEIPEKVQIDGGIMNTDSRLLISNDGQGKKITGAKLEMDLKATVEINGVKINFNSTISHTLTDWEMLDLMTEFNK